MLHYQCCLTCLPHTRLSCSCFFSFRSQIAKVLLKALLMMWACKQSLIALLLIIIGSRFSLICTFDKIAKDMINCMIQKYIWYMNAIRKVLVVQYYCMKLFVWKSEHQVCRKNSQHTSSSSWHELKCFLTVCRILLPPLQHCFLSLTLDQKLSFLPSQTY